MTDTRDKLPSRPSSIGQAHRIIVQLKARVEELDAMLMLDPTYADLTAKVAALEAQVEQYDKADRNRWVLVNDQLPKVSLRHEYGNWVLASNGNHVGVVKLIDMEDGDPPEWQDECGEPIYDLVEWMPRPSPSKQPTGSARTRIADMGEKK